MARRRRAEEEERHEAWAIPYGDLVTLLLAFFVVMYSMSSVNEGKYRVLSTSLTRAFHGVPRAPEPIQAASGAAPGIVPLPLTQVRQMISVGLPVRSAPLLVAAARVPPARMTPAIKRPGSKAGTAALTSAAAAAQTAELERIATRVSAAMAPLIAAGRLHVQRKAGAVVVDISTDILFPSGVARLSRPAVAALQRLAAVLAPLPNALRVEGHTDNRPIHTREFPSNWELSAARAASVVHLFMDRGIAPERMAVIGFGQYRPLEPNITPAGRNANRRVAVVILGRDNSAGNEL